MNIHQDARAAIQAALLAADPKSPLQILGHVLLENTAEGFLATGSDARMQVVRSAPRLDGPDFAACVPALRLGAVLKLPHAELSATLTEKTLTLRGGASRFALPRLPVEDFPRMTGLVSTSEITMAGADLHRALEKVLPFAAIHDVRYWLVGMHVERRDGELCFVATDGAGMAALRVPSSGPEFAAILSRETCKVLRSLVADGDLRIAVEGYRARLTQGPLTIDMATLDGCYPDWRRVMPDAQPGRLLLKAGEAEAVLAEASLLGQEDAARMRCGRLEIGHSGITVRSGSEDGGAYEGVIPCSASLPREAAFRVDALREICALFPRSADVTVDYPDAVRGAMPFVFRSPAVPGFTAVYQQMVL